MTYFSAKTFILSPRSLSISSIRGPKHKPWVEQGGIDYSTNVVKHNYSKAYMSTNYNVCTGYSSTIDKQLYKRYAGWYVRDTASLSLWSPHGPKTYCVAGYASF